MGRLRRWSVAAIGVLASLLGGEPGHASGQDRWARLATPVFRTYTQDDGLPNPFTTALGQDGDGFLWIGTEGGLARWDGYRFRTYLPAAGDGGALPDSWITTLHTDPEGTLWVGTSAGGLARYDRDRDRFVTFATAAGLSNVHIYWITDDGAAGLWIATGGGLDHLDGRTARIDTLHHVATDPGSLPDDQVLSLLRDRGGTLWTGTKQGLSRRPPGSSRFEPVPLGDDPSRALAVASLMEDSGGRIWIGTTDRGAFMLAPGEVLPHPVRETAGAGPGLEREWVFAMTQAGAEEVWLSTYGHGIVAVDARTGQTHRIRHDALLRQSLGDEIVSSLTRDRSGAVWAGTYSGVSRLESSADGPALTVFGHSSDPEGLTQSDATATLVASDGHVWVGLRTTGIDILDPAVGRVATVAADPHRPDTALPAAMVLSMVQQASRVFIASNGGLYRTDTAGCCTTRLMPAGRDPAARTFAVLPAGGKLWVAGSDDGIWAIDPDAPGVSGKPGASAEHFGEERLTNVRGTTLAAGAEGDLWIGTRNGLNRLDLRSHEVEKIFPDPARPDALAAGFVANLRMDRSGRLWVATLGGGIQVLTGRAGGRPVFHRIGTAQGLPDDNVDCLLADEAGRIWASTDNGIAVIDPESFAVHALHRAEGVAISAYWAGSCAATANGELLFGGAGGLTVIRPEKFASWTYQPPIVITDVRVGGKAVPAGGFNSGREAAPMLVQPDANSLVVEFAALDYSAPDRNRYAYRLEGYDRNWVSADPGRRLAAYTNLPPGSYTLHLRGSNRAGLWVRASLDIPVRVLPAWFQTLWFRIALCGLGAACGYAILQIRTRYLRHRQRELEHQVAGRTAELEESRRQIEQIAYHDALTGLPNRRLFTEDMQKLTSLHASMGHGFSLLLIDLDKFKQINDALGHDAGDALLVEAARRMRATLRVSDRLVRLGGDEFAILIAEGVSADQDDEGATEAVCRRIVECFAAPIHFDGNAMKTSASVGAAHCPAHGRNPDTLYKAADLALYEAKRAGRSTWRMHGAAAGRNACPTATAES